MKDWVWLSPEALLAAHEEQLAEHGGAAGSYRSLLESALSRPQHLATYGDPDAASLAAAYGFGLAKNHAFIDGKKRVALVAMESFLLLNGYQITADDAQIVLVMLSVGASTFHQDELADWIRKNIEPL